jgi:ankyrin repeat protein
MGIFPKALFSWLVTILISMLPVAAIAEIDLLSNDRLIEATKADDQVGAEALLVRGHNVDVRDENRRTSLFFAAIQGNEDFVELLLRFNPRVNTVDKFGSSPLYYAAAGNNVGVIEMLAEKNADLDAQNRQGLTPLMVAASEGHLAAVQTLFDLKADSTLTDFTGRTAFDWALRNNRQAVIRFMKTAGIGS